MLRRQAGTQHVTRLLGDSIHAYAVMSALAAEGRATGFVAYRPFAPLFANGPLAVSISDDGTQWWSMPRAFRGPQHGEHVRDTMAGSAGVVDQGLLRVKLTVALGAPPADQPYVIICPNAGMAYKEWPQERWGAVIEHLLRRYDVFVCGMPGKPRIPTPSGATHLEMGAAALAYLIAGAKTLIGPDSGHLHLADALGVRVIGLYGATSSLTYGPYHDRTLCIDTHAEHLSANGCYSSAEHGQGCRMDTISVARVLEAVSQIDRP